MKILIIQLRRIGDILLTTPSVAYLKQVFPDAKIDFLADPMGQNILETNPKINQLLIYDKSHPLKFISRIRKEKYDAVIDFMNNPRTRLLTALSGAKWKVGLKKSFRSFFYNVAVPEPRGPIYAPLWKLELIKFWLKIGGFPTPNPKQIHPEIFLTKEDLDFARIWSQGEQLKTDFAVLMPSHRHPNRKWGAQNFQKLGQLLRDKNHLAIYLSGGPGEENYLRQVRAGHENEIKILPTGTIRQAAAIIQKSKLVVATDSGGMHTAVAIKTPTVTIYGPSEPRDWNPSYQEKNDPPRDIALTARDVACLGCRLNSCPFELQCMTHLSVEDVYLACQQIISR